MERDKDGLANIILWISVRVLVNIVFLFVLVEAFVSAWQFSYKVFTDIPYKPTSSEQYDITIEPGSSAGEIAALLDDGGIVDNKYTVLARIYLGEYNTRIMAGTYTLGPGMSPDEICRKICGMQGEDAS